MNLMTTAMTNTTHMSDSAENTIDIRSEQVCFKLVLFEGYKVDAGAHLFVLLCFGVYSFLKQEPYTNIAKGTTDPGVDCFDQ